MYAGCVEDAEESYIHGCDRQCHFCYLLGAHMIVHILDNEVGSIKVGPYVIPTVHTIIMFSAAVNPYAYALINERFREKMKRMICCNSTSSTTRIAPARGQQGIEMADNIGNQSSKKSRRTSTE